MNVHNEKKYAKYNKKAKYIEIHFCETIDKNICE